MIHFGYLQCIKFNRIPIFSISALPLSLCYFMIRTLQILWDGSIQVFFFFFVFFFPQETFRFYAYQFDNLARDYLSYADS